MRAGSKSLMFVLLACVVTAPVAALTFSASRTPHQRPAGCHDEGNKTPAPEPVTHQCCQSGHDAAVVQKAHPPSLVASAILTLTAAEPTTLSPRLPASQPIQSGAPPGLTALRI